MRLVNAWDDVFGVLWFFSYVVYVCEHNNKKRLFAQPSMTMTMLLICRIVCPFVHV